VKPFAQELHESKKNLISLFSSGKVTAAFQELYTEMVDQYFRRSMQESKIGQRLFRDKTPLAFMAVGGYGRRGLCLHSDIDLLILFGRHIPKNADTLVDEILYPLWDIGMDLGYAIRTIGDCISLGQKDFASLASMLDARFLCGNSQLYMDFVERFYDKVISKRKTAFRSWLEEQEENRARTFGSASYLLEPNLKEGIGGLRDYHHILWLSKTLFQLGALKELEKTAKISQEEYNNLVRCVQFILIVRNHLHLIPNRKNDRLGFEYQEEIAKRLGYKNRRDFLAVEQFLGKLHSAMVALHTLRNSFAVSLARKEVPKEKGIDPGLIPGNFRLFGKELSFANEKDALHNPLLLMEIFELSSRLGYPLSFHTRRKVRELLYLVNDDFIKSEWASTLFIHIIKNQNCSQTLDQMFETGFLGTFIPEFGRIAHRVQFDAYHIFPVGRHSLETIKYLKSIHKQKEILLPGIFLELPNPESLLLAALFHDIGKTGRDHANKGVITARGVLKRFNLGPEITNDILFLIQHHLLLAETATRRDLGDERIVLQFALKVETVRRLKMLYLLTWADSKATNPTAWNDWIATLVQELFFKTLHILEGSQLAAPDTSRKIKRIRSKLRKALAATTNTDDLERILDAISTRYLLNTPVSDIIHHIEMAQKISGLPESQKDTTFFFHAKEADTADHWEAVLLAKDRPGLFSDITGILALNDINILSADIYTWQDSTAVDVFKVDKPLDPIHTNEIWDRVRNDLTETLGKGIHLHRRLSEKAAASFLHKKKRPNRHPTVKIDNESSDFFTIIDVYADDQMGLLYIITNTLFRLGLDIRVARIASKADQIADTFYVRDLEGQKIEDDERLREIKKTLLHELK
jgi:[protein-PII] uridylyltransferase